MTEPLAAVTRRKLKTPRAAAIAGILFALLFGTGVVLIRISIPADPVEEGAWLETNSRTVSLALNLVPYAGIAFLWFIGVIRDRLGDLEDRLFATVFLGSGLLFLALTFVGSALAGGLLTSFAAAPNALVESGVFMISLGTIWLRTGSMRRGWALLTYALALVLLVSISYSLWVTLIFPGWVLVISIYFLILNLREPRQDILDEI